MAQMNLGNKEQFYNECYTNYYGDIFRMARKILGSSHDADDIAQNVFMHFWRVIEKYDPSRSAVKTFIIMIFLNKLSSFFKKKKRLDDALYCGFGFITNDIYDEKDYAFGCEEGEIFAEIANYLYSYLRTDDFIIFYLRLKGWSLKDVSKIFGITDINCNVRYFRIKNKLKESFLIDKGEGNEHCI